MKPWCLQPAGYWHDPSTGYYYDANTGQYYNSQSQQWLMYDQSTGQYTPSASTAAATNSEQQHGQQSSQSAQLYSADAPGTSQPALSAGEG